MDMFDKLIAFIDYHHDLFYKTLPDIFQNKWVWMFINICIFIVLIKLANFFIEKFVNKLASYKEDYEYKKQLYTLKTIAKSVVSTVLGIFALMFVLNTLGVDIRPILTAAGVLGVAVGFGAKRFVEDIISGLSLILEGQIRVGDYVDISGHEGTVEKIDIRLAKLRDLQGRVHYIRNGMIDTVVNYTREYSYYVFDIGVAYKEDVSQVIKVLESLGEEFRRTSNVRGDILAPLEILGLDKFDDSAVVIRARFKTNPTKQWAVGRAFNQEIKRKFDELGIEIPFPQRVMHLVNEQSDIKINA